MIPVVIPAYNRQDQLHKCLRHLAEQTVDIDVYVHDNTKENIYYTAAMNQGILRYLDRKCNYIILLNQDMYLEPNAIEQMLTFMKSNPQCGIGSPLQLHSDNNQFVIWAGGYEAFPTGKHQQGSLSEYENNEQVAWCTGCCMILRKQMVREIGILDENYVLIGSDSDYCFTARSRGWQIWRIGSARGIHECGCSVGGADSKIEQIKANDMLYFGRKWITAELYKSLSYEGSELTANIIADAMAILKEISDESSGSKFGNGNNTFEAGIDLLNNGLNLASKKRNRNNTTATLPIVSF